MKADKALTMRDVLVDLKPGFRPRLKPTWPPDAFALMATVVKRSGAYVRVVHDWRPSGFADKAAWKDAVGIAAESWSESASRDRWPKLVGRWWTQAMTLLDRPLSEIATEKVGVDAMLGIIAAADQACEGVGFWQSSETALQIEALSRLWRHHSLCRDLDASRVRVLPKLHNPYDGLTLRSLTHHIALWTNAEVAVLWQHVDLETVDVGMNMLLLPWPLVINPHAFTGGPGPTETDSGYFTYSPPPFPGVERVQQLVDEAERMVGEVHALVWPESSLRLEDVQAVQRVFPGKLLIAGVMTPAPEGCRFGANHVAVASPTFAPTGLIENVKPILQSKHHRWRIDEQQICAYGLGPSFARYRAMWEGIEVSRRECNFYNVNDWLTLSVLICEDLARQDPVAELIRTVGPNLLIALLMDGPQLKGRWSAHYATVLADDPRTSVLTLTSAGMVELSNSQYDGASSRKVALWRDAVGRVTHEIELAKGAEAIVLTLGSTKQEEKTADGRSDGGTTGYVVLQGVQQVFLRGSEIPASGRPKTPEKPADAAKGSEPHDHHG